MKVLHIIGTLNIGGIQKYILSLINSCELSNYSHSILSTILSPNNFQDKYDKNHISIYNLPFMPNPNTRIPFRINKLVRNLISRLYFFKFWQFLMIHKVDIIHSHIHNHIISQILAALFSGTRIIWTIHGQYKINKSNIFIIYILNMFFHRTKFQIIADSKPALKTTLGSYYKNFYQKNIIPTGIELNPYLQKFEKYKIRKKYKINNNSILIGSTGRIVWQKGYDLLISLLENYDFGSKDIYFIIAGDGSLKNKYIADIKSKNLDKKIKFIGIIDNIPEFLSDIDIYIHPSVTEGFPLSVLEAMASNLPIICSNAGGLKDMIINNTNGLIFNYGDLNSLYAVIQKAILMSREELLILGRNAKDTVRKYYSIEHIADKYHKLYSENILVNE